MVRHYRRGHDSRQGSIKILSVQQAVDKLINEAEILIYIESLKQPKKGQYYSERKDTLQETTRGYGKTDKPEDYLESFTKFVNENQDKIEAIKIVCTKPSDLRILWNRSPLFADLRHCQRWMCIYSAQSRSQ